MSDRVLVFEDFADKVGQSFALSVAGAPPIPLTLTEAEAHDVSKGMPGSRTPFSLVFIATHPAVLPQQIYQLAHDVLGDLTVFLVPIGKDARGVSYQATFS
jgi:hypothetical protein